MDISAISHRLQQTFSDFFTSAPNLLVGFAVFVLFIFVSRGIRFLVHRFNAPRRHRNLALALGRLAQWGTLLLGLLVSVTIAFPSFTPADLIGALGVTGIAIGFAFRDVLENFLAGILILINEPFRIDDQIRLGEYEGTVENIETRATSIRTYDGRRVVIPNAQLFKSSVIVNTAFETRRMEYDVGIGVSDDIASAKRIMLDAIAGVEGVVPDPAPDALVVRYGPSSIDIRIRWWIKPPRRADALDITDRVLTTVKQALVAEGIDLPYPTRQILFHDQTEETDGDRRRQREGWPAGKDPMPKPGGVARALTSPTRPSREERSGD